MTIWSILFILKNFSTKILRLYSPPKNFFKLPIEKLSVVERNRKLSLILKLLPDFSY